jgi:hypothetical protein
VHATGQFARRPLKLLCAALHNGLRSFILRSSTNVVDPEAQSLDQDRVVVAEDDGTLSLDLPDMLPTSDLEAPSIKWLLETSTDPEVFIAAARLVPLVEWPLDLDVSDTLPQLYDVFRSCVGFDGEIVPSLQEKATACAMALGHLYHGCVLHAHPGHIIFFGSKTLDEIVFRDVWLKFLSRGTVPAMAVNLCSSVAPGYTISDADSVPALEQMLHLLPYHFVTGRAAEYVGGTAIEVMSKLVSSSPSSPSEQIIANCILLACAMVGVQFDKKDIIRIDKRCCRLICCCFYYV